MLPRGLGTPLTSGTGSFSEAQISLAPAFVQETLSSHLLSAADSWLGYVNVRCKLHLCVKRSHRLKCSLSHPSNELKLVAATSRITRFSGMCNRTNGLNVPCAAALESCLIDKRRIELGDERRLFNIRNSAESSSSTHAHSGVLAMKESLVIVTEHSEKTRTMFFCKLSATSPVYRR